jgi:hypothetical protein
VSVSGRAMTAWRLPTVPCAPSPPRSDGRVTAGSFGSCSRPCRVIARATGCRDSDSRAAAMPSTRSRFSPGAGTTSVTVISPLVTVPVLSSTMVSMRRVDSSTPAR